MQIRTTRWIRPGWACLIVLGWPAMADAQLFPNLAIRRERPESVVELPVYGLYRREYYGHYPTCWRRFPPGWGCPTPEAPNWEAELAKRPLEIPDAGDDAGATDDALGGLNDPFDPGGGGDLPALPNQRDPFELDSPDGAAPPSADPPAPVRPNDQPSPFDLPGNGGARFEALPSVSPPVARRSARTYTPEPDLPPPSFEESTAGAISVDASMPGPAVASTSASVPFVGMGTVPGQAVSSVLVGEGELWQGDAISPDPTYIEAPEARQPGRVRGFLSGLLYGRGLRR